MLKISFDKSNFNVYTLPPDEFPVLPKIKEGKDHRHQRVEQKPRTLLDPGDMGNHDHVHGFIVLRQLCKTGYSGKCKRLFFISIKLLY